MLKLAIFAVLVAAATAAISSSCLHAICVVESGCQPLGCKYDVNGNACGYYQIHTGYYSDCGSPGSSWQACAKDKSCADSCVRAYMNRYGTYCTGGRTPTCEDYARIHNGGPKGCVHSNTLGYWHKVQTHIG
ncbi:lysozyme 3-like [Haliotis rufescens]|uniref:lysozyme 3-like n=1 Tax=Haliotis rufescens TaxID=6454 RepID=UPI001EAF98A7|nr:lysozyme 3-like [Haliotis rufescens]